MAFIAGHGLVLFGTSEGDTVQGFNAPGSPGDRGGDQILTGFDQISSILLYNLRSILNTVLQDYRETAVEVPDGNDVLLGGLGNDTLFGGGGTDIAVLAGREPTCSMVRITCSVGGVTTRFWEETRHAPPTAVSTSSTAGLATTRSLARIAATCSTAETELMGPSTKGLLLPGIYTTARLLIILLALVVSTEVPLYFKISDPVRQLPLVRETTICDQSSMLHFWTVRYQYL